MINEEQNLTVKLIEQDQANQNPNFSSKIVILGNKGVGKKTFFKTFNSNASSSLSSSFASSLLGAPSFDTMTIRCMINDKYLLSLNFWNTTDDGAFTALTQNVFRGAHLVLLFYDITSLDSFQGLSKWIKEIDYYKDNLTKVCLIGNKVDLPHERKVTLEQAQNFAKDNQIEFTQEVSFLKGNGLETLIDTIAKITYKQIADWKKNISQESPLDDSSINISTFNNDNLKALTINKNPRRICGC